VGWNFSHGPFDQAQNVGYTFSESNPNVQVWPQPLMIRINDFGIQGNQGQPSTVFPPNWPYPPDGTSQIASEDDWEESVSMSIDLADNLTFWGVGQYLPNGNQTSCCNWYTQIFLCEAGSGFCK
jgi:hypothetical protein